MGEEKKQKEQAADNLSDEERRRIAEALGQRGAIQPCPRCGTKSFTVLDGYFIHPLNPNFSGGLHLGGPSVPVAVVACTNCGFLSEHALGALGLLEPGEEE